MKRLLWILVAAMLGAGIALLFAPASGRKTRKKIRKRAEQLRLQMEAQAEQKFNMLNEFKNSAEEKLEQKVQQLNANGAPMELHLENN